MIAPSDRRRLLSIARESLEARVRRGAAPKPPGDIEVDAYGVFVSVHHRGDLRGCLGALDMQRRLAEEVVRLAAAVAHEDRRFAPLVIDELPGVTIDLSVLTPPELVANPLEIVVGRHGLIVEHGRYQGLLLPQVAPEHGWDRDAFLAHTCVKAGLPPTAWRNGATLLRFEAEVFGDER